MNTVKVENCKTLFIGRRGENEVTEVVFDFSEWQEQFGAGVIDLYVKRNLDVDAYPVVLSVDGTVATWLVTAADTDVVGNGKIEFVYTVNEKVAKSAVFPFFVGEDIGESSPEPPEHYQSWLEQLTELGAETQANAQAAAQSASEAAESAAQVAEDSNNAEAWAVGERNGEPVSEDDPTYNNNAKYWAKNARANAPVQSVNGEDGDVVLTLDDIPNGETYVRATPEQLAQITTNAENIASVEAIASTALQPDDLTPYRTAAQQSSIDNDLNSKINRNTGSIADINARIPFSASASNKLVDQNSFDSKLSDYRTASQQNLIDNNKQTKITANGILKGNGLGGISAAVAGMDYLPTSALAAYRSANAQDAIDNAQNQNINKNTAAINTMQPAATAADIGKALIVKTVADGKPTSYEYGEAGGGSSALTAGDGIDISNDVISNTQGIEYIVGTQTAATSKWTGVSTDETLKVGKIIAYYLPFAGTSTAATLALTMADGTTTREISLQLKPNATVTTQFPAGSMIILVYDGTYWRVNASYDTDTNTYPTGYCVTNGSVAAKAAACSFGYRGDATYFPCLFRYANTAADATLAITTYAPEAAPIYVNGARTSAENTFSAGVILFLYYNGAYYCYNDGRFPILVDGAVTSVQEYATGLLVNYRTAAAQDTIDAGKQAKITATGILKGDGAGGVSSATAGTDYATPQQVNEKYAKPSGGIPSTDMTAAVQASLSKADTALQAVPDTYRTAADQDVIDNEQDERLDAVEQTTTATTIGPSAIATFDASAADMPLKGLTVNIEPVQSGIGDPSPDNVREIFGWTKCNIANSSKNIFDIDNAIWIHRKYIKADGTISTNNNYKYCANFTPIIGGRKITVSGTRESSAAVFGVPLAFYDDQKEFLSRITTFPTTSTSAGYVQVTVDVPEDAAYFRLNMYDVSVPVSDFQIEYGDTATEYQPFASSMISWEDEAGTVYGGTLDVVSGKLSVEYASLTLPNADSIRDSTVAGTGKWVRYSLPRNASTNDDTVNVIGEKLKGINRSPTEYRAAWTMQTYLGNSNRYLSVFVPADYTLEQIDAAIAGSQIVYKLTTPIVYDLTDIPEITTLLGENNIWADTGDVTATYGAYLETVKAYAEKVGDSILSAIAPLEMSYTASRAYTAGSFLFVGTKFYKVTAAIASGDTIIPGTNVTQTTVAEQLMALANV